MGSAANGVRADYRVRHTDAQRASRHRPYSPHLHAVRGGHQTMKRVRGPDGVVHLLLYRTMVDHYICKQYVRDGDDTDDLPTCLWCVSKDSDALSRL
jgi:hypothetical protein